VARSLLPNERAALDALDCEFKGAVALREQAASVLADGSGLIIELVVDHSFPQADVTTRVPVGAPVIGDDWTWSNGLILFVEESRLSLWNTGERRTRCRIPFLRQPRSGRQSLASRC
jgi:hypothetical protein